MFFGDRCSLLAAPLSCDSSYNITNSVPFFFFLQFYPTAGLLFVVTMVFGWALSACAETFLILCISEDHFCYLESNHEIM